MLTSKAMLLTPRTLRMLLLSYALKTLIVGIAWLVVPDLPQLAATKVREAWSRITDAPERPASPSSEAR